MTNEMIERVARAIGRYHVNESHWQDYVPDARAAIAAMRGPTDAMIRAGEKIYARCIWQAMIDAALEGDRNDFRRD